MVLEETLKNHFQSLGINAEDRAVLAKCMDLCDIHQLDEETFVETWVAFAVETNSAMEPNLESLGRMERSIQKKEIKNNINDAKSISVNHSLNQSNLAPSLLDDDNQDILEMYGYSAPAASTVKRPRSPEDQNISAVNEMKIRALETTFSPASYIRKSETPRRNVKKDIRGKTLLKIGRDDVNWKTTNKRQVKIAKTNDPHVPAQSTYMFDLLSIKASNLKSVCREFGARLCSNWHKITGKDAAMVTSDVRNKSQSIFRTWGRISSETDEKLKANAVLLEGCKPHTYYRNLPDAIPLDLTDVPSYSIFPGQITAVECTNPTGNSLVAKSLFASGYPPPSPSPKLQEALHIVVAAGPFTNFETLDYQPLFDLLDNVAEIEPHVLILIGPFVPFDHPEISNATVLDTFQDLFQQIVDKIAKYTKGKCTQVVLVSSSRDAHHDPIYPTPEFFLPKSGNALNFHLMPDPCMIDVEGLTIGVTSVDIIRHLGGEETSHNMTGMDRLGRLGNHLLSQGCFYPLYPPSKDVNIDTSLWEKYAFMYQQPHILIVPSNMKHFCNWTKDCIIINPERLNKYSYARIIVRPTLNGPLTSDNFDCEILKI